MDPEIIDDRKSVIEAAFTEQETAAAAPSPAPAPADTPADTPAQAPAQAPSDSAAPAPTKADSAAPAGDSTAPAKADSGTDDDGKGTHETKPADRAPQSWKPATRAQWDKLPPEVRDEVARREHQTAKVLSETAAARQVATSLQQAVQPYNARLQSLGLDPVRATQELLKSDHLLSTAPKAQRAQYMAKMIKDYDVDIEALDEALSGRAQQERDPNVQIQAQVQQLLQQQLAPYQQLLAREQQREQQESQGLHGTIQQMASNVEKYPYFEDVRQDMADIIDLAAKRGRQITLDEAYNRATLLDPEISKLTQASQAAQNAAKANAQAQRAKQASVSVGGAPSGLLSGSPAGDRRAIIAAAFDSAAGR